MEKTFSIQVYLSYIYKVDLLKKIIHSEDSEYTDNFWLYNNS